MRLRAVVVDDEALARRGICALLERAGGVTVVRECADGFAAIEAVRDTAPDVIYLDIEMPGMSGFDVIRTVGADEMPNVVFVTAFDQYAVRAFEVCALDYLLKPIDEERFAAVLERASAVPRRREHPHAPGKDLASIARLQPLQRHDDFDGGYFPVRTGEKILPLRVCDVYAVVAAGNYVSLQTKGKSWLVRDTIAEIEARFSPLGFVRIHRSTIVNIERIAELEPLENGEYDVILHDGTEFRLSRSYRDAVKRIFLRDPR